MARPKASDRDAALRRLPKIDELLARDDIAAAGAELPRWAVKAGARELVDRRRREILAAETPPADEWVPSADEVCAIARELAAPSLKRLVNATGVVLHTNFGRAPLSDAALAAIADVAAYSNLEYDIAKGKRGSRHGHLRDLVRELVGAEDAAVVNNNAAATMLGVGALASGREVIVSRGELVEIGGSFRIPDVLRLSGATLVEVGTTNKTRIADYAAAITENTALLLKVHRSNFAVVGFSEEASAAELAKLGRERGVATMYDLGSGSLLSEAEVIEMGLEPEESAADAVAAGIDLVTFSGDKLLGGPQAGLLAGRATAVEKCRKHPLMRALRPDKLTIAALGATLGAYRDAGPGRRPEAIPAMSMLGAGQLELKEHAEALLKLVRDSLPTSMSASLYSMESAVGGGAMPLAVLPSWGVAIRGASPDAIEAALRRAPVAVIGRITEEVFVLDARTIRPCDHVDIAAAVATLGRLK